MSIAGVNPQAFAKLCNEAKKIELVDVRTMFIPLLLKFLDARDTLSVQVHPSDRQADYLPAGETGKTEAWVVLEAEPESRIYAGLKPATTADNLRRAVANGTAADHLACFTPKPGDGQLEHNGAHYALGKGDVLLLPAVVGACLCQPRSAISVLELSLPEGNLTQ
jgi:hypothetical protein